MERASHSRDKLLKEITGGGFSSVKYMEKWKDRLDQMLEQKTL